MIIAVDFDGTLVEHDYPSIGKEVPGAFEWLKKFKEFGARLILLTMRCDSKKNNTYTLRDAVEYCNERGIEFWAVNNNPQQCGWTDSPKCYAHIYIDDAAIGCPLIKNKDGRDYVDWSKVGPIVMEILGDTED